MRINISIDRVAEPDDKTKKIESQILKSLIATEFPVGILHSHPSERNLHFSGTIEDFIKAIGIKKEFLESSQTVESKKEKNKKLMPIYEKSKEIDHEEKTL